VLASRLPPPRHFERSEGFSLSCSPVPQGLRELTFCPSPLEYYLCSLPLHSVLRPFSSNSHSLPQIFALSLSWEFPRKAKAKETDVSLRPASFYLIDPAGPDRSLCWSPEYSLDFVTRLCEAVHFFFFLFLLHKTYLRCSDAPGRSERPAVCPNFPKSFPPLFMQPLWAPSSPLHVFLSSFLKIIFAPHVSHLPLQPVPNCPTLAGAPIVPPPCPFLTHRLGTYHPSL